jgi:hemolysin activation/secretion protein
LKTAQFGIQSNLDFYIPIKTRSTIKLGSKTGFIFNENMFTNELFRIGGNITLRGFDEESLYNSSFAIGTIEYRFLLEQNSNIFGFIDGAWYENRVKGKFISDTPIGVGAGVNFSTKPGIFSISYALGSQKGSPFIFKSAKIHFGFISFF